MSARHRRSDGSGQAAKRALRSALQGWIAITLLVFVSVAAIQIRYGRAGFGLFIQQWAFTNLTIMLAATALTWLSVGFLLWLLATGRVTASNALTVLGLFVVVFLYLNVLRERFRYGDYQYYIEAATALLERRPLPDTYLYLPFWAFLLQFIAALGDQGILLVLWSLNILALAGFYLLMQTTLQRYGFTPRLAALVTAFFILINAPIQRTLGFVQVNLIVMDLILLAVLWFPRSVWLSALAMALAVHLKTSPVVLVLAFLLERDRRWLLAFVASFVVVGAFPLLVNGPGPYGDFLRNSYALTQITDTNFHETSIDSLLRFVNPFFGISAAVTRAVIYALKAVLLAAVILVMMRAAKNQTFSASGQRGVFLMNALPALFVLMTLAPPIVWDHHALFIALPALVLLATLSTPAEWLWFGLAYTLEFVLPSFDFFPWSFGRLLAPLIFLALIWRASQHDRPRSSLPSIEKLLSAWAAETSGRPSK